MDLKYFMSSKKPRRSDRLCKKDKASSVVAVEQVKHAHALAEWHLGYFDMLPIEVKFKVFSYLSVENLSYLTICSKSMRNVVEGYRVTRFSGPHHVPYKKLHCQHTVMEQTELLNLFFKQGILMKRSTCLYATKDRLKIITEFLTRMACSNNNCPEPYKCVSLLCFGTFLHTVIAGWDDSECQKVFECITQHMGVQRQIKTVVSSRPGSHSHLEVWVRNFFRRLFLDPCSTVTEKAFWLTRILKPWPLVFQARLLLVLYCGHICGGEIQWHEMSESTPADSDSWGQYYSSIASALLVLYTHSTEWSSDEVICILDEITCIPEDWLIENTAGLLLSCGETITTKMLKSKAINGRLDELASIIASLCLVCVKHGQPMKVVMSILESVLYTLDLWKDRLALLCKVAETFKELIMDTHEFTDSDEAGDGEFFHHLTAMTEFVKQLIQLAFKNSSEQ